MNKGLEALKRMSDGQDMDCYEIIEKELKALEIIKIKKVNVFLLNNANLMNYNFLSIDKERFLSKEEFIKGGTMR